MTFIRRFTLILSAFLAGCTTYAWQHPERTASQEQADSLQCEQTALNMYPTRQVKVETAPAYVAPDKTTCKAVKGGTKCVTERGERRQATYRTRDVNSFSRYKAMEKCMRGLGYVKVEVK